MKRLDIHVHCDSTDKAELDILADACRKQNTIAALSGGLRYGGHDFAPNEFAIVFNSDNFSSCALLKMQKN